jgi:hypothetical protein
MARTHVKWTDDARRTLRTMWLAGCTTGDIGETLGHSTPATSAEARRLGLGKLRGAGLAQDVDPPLVQRGIEQIVHDAFGDMDPIAPLRVVALVAMAAAIVGGDDRRISMATGLPVKVVLAARAMLARTGADLSRGYPAHWVGGSVGEQAMIDDLRAAAALPGATQLVEAALIASIGATS